MEKTPAFSVITPNPYTVIITEKQDKKYAKEGMKSGIMTCTISLIIDYKIISEYLLNTPLTTDAIRVIQTYVNDEVEMKTDFLKITPSSTPNFICCTTCNIWLIEHEFKFMISEGFFKENIYFGKDNNFFRLPKDAINTAFGVYSSLQTIEPIAEPHNVQYIHPQGQDMMMNMIYIIRAVKDMFIRKK